MKKLTLTLLLFLALYSSANAQNPIDQCYYTSSDGKVWVKGKFAQSINPVYITYTNTELTDEAWPYNGIQENDLDGHNTDYLFQFNTTAPNGNLPYNNTYSGQDCITDYSYSYQYYRSPIPQTICPCYPVPLATCIKDIGGGYLQVTLVFDHIVGIVNPTMYLFTKTGSSAPHYSASATFVTTYYDDETIYTFTIPAFDLRPIVWNACNPSPTQLYFYNNWYWDDQSTLTSVTDPSVFAEAIQVAPCCAASCSPREDKFTYSINTAYPNTVRVSNAEPGIWDMGDGAHTYPNKYYNFEHDYSGAYGAYNVILEASEDNNSVCEKASQQICLPTITQTESFATGAVPHPCAGINFSLEFDNYGAVQLTAFGLPAGSGSTITWNAWSGTLPVTSTYAGPTVHQYSFSGSISPNIELLTQMVPGTIGSPTCSITMSNECIYQKHAPNAVKQINDDISAITLAPNPASDHTSLVFTLSVDQSVEIKVYDMIGHTVAEIPSQRMSCGYHTIELNTANLSAGTYNISIQTSTGATTQKLSLIK